MTQAKIDLPERFAGKDEDKARAERKMIGFVRQPMTRWLDPKLLAASALEVAISDAFGRLADKRESLVNPTEPADYSARDELWLDFLSDTGDGFHATYTMAWLLAQGQLDVGSGRALPRGELLVLGGDQVYPSASIEAYEDHFLGPFASALPWSEPESGAPHLWAVPGNHDWYDGLTSFLRVFCRKSWIGGWRTRQSRSYFALKLPHGWWLWAIDIQFDTYLDSGQLEYFADMGGELREGDNVLLVTAKPSWGRAKAGLLEPVSWRYLSYFEERYVKHHGAKLVATLTGDLHHYSRYAPVDGAAPVRITAGGGGAYLSPTHTLPGSLVLKSLDVAEPVAYERERIYPDEDASKARRKGVWLLGIKNPGFGRMMGVVYALLAATTLAALGAGSGKLVANAQRGGVFDFLAAALGGATVVVAFVLALALIVYADVGRFAWKLVVGTLHAALHLLVLEAVVYFLLKVLDSGTVGLWAWALALPVAFGVGFVFGSLIFAGFLFFIHILLGERAQQHANEVFASQAIAGYKNFLRMHIDSGGTLTIYPLGVEKACTEWDACPSERERARPHFTPRGEPPRAELIEGPLTYGG